jgi:hypothetical protein
MMFFKALIISSSVCRICEVGDAVLRPSFEAVKHFSAQYGTGSEREVG